MDKIPLSGDTEKCKERPQDIYWIRWDANNSGKENDMPRPNLLPLLNWRDIITTAKTYEEWQTASEIPAHRDRIEKARKELKLPADTQAAVRTIRRNVHVVAIAEDWCGDVVRHVPPLERLARENPLIQTRYIAREQHLDVFARFLTNGGEAIPKFIFLSADLVETGNWGPMPTACRKLIARGKALNDVSAARKKVSECYAADPELQIVISELTELLQIAAATEV